MKLHYDYELRHPSAPLFEEPACDDPFVQRERFGRFAAACLVASILIMGFIGFCLAQGIANEQAAIERSRV